MWHFVAASNTFWLLLLNKASETVGGLMERLCNMGVWRGSVKSFCCLFSARHQQCPLEMVFGAKFWAGSVSLLWHKILGELRRPLRSCEIHWPWGQVVCEFIPSGGLRADCPGPGPASRTAGAAVRAEWPRVGGPNVGSTTGELRDTIGGCPAPAREFHPASGPVCFAFDRGSGPLGKRYRLVLPSVTFPSVTFPGQHVVPMLWVGKL